MSDYLYGKEMGLDYAEFYLRHIHPTENEVEKNLLRAAAEVIRERKMVVQQEILDLRAKQSRKFEEKNGEILERARARADRLMKAGGK